MKESIDFSIIIPHKNDPVSLQRCLDSIPHLNNIQIIIVDDNSDSNIVDFDLFPGINGKDIEVYFNKEGKGAGYARNVGMSKAKGKWLIFADADDYFTSSFYSTILKYVNSNSEVIFFNIDCDKVMSKQGNAYQQKIDAYNPNIQASIDNLKYGVWVPWSKMYKKSFIDFLELSFEERIVGNDCFFVLIANYNTKVIEVDRNMIYYHTFNKTSLSHGHNNDWVYDIERMKLFIWRARFYSSIGHSDWLKGAGIYTFLINIKEKYGFYIFLKSFVISIKQRANFFQPIFWKLKNYASPIKS
ncbi:glycosyltransferase family 2 protein [Polaribacter sp. Q13]|uniref:glycosyltransferase family 2 protein n=1 Tax=Polaribacter sp. Q13 TaxID=2806551 RepID=UPI00193C04AE|nr:glycosyltransferase family 2 protein [Polaribacter sp. Q13]QVY66627.1 glycosyltransferase family 2 protein [Polaribacter sp. Q13]